MVDLFPQEQELVESAREGKILDLRGRSETAVRGSVIRDLIVNADAYRVDPIGILIQGADVSELHLADVEATVSVRLGYCRVGDIDLSRSRFPFLNFHDSRIRSLTADSLDCTHDFYMAGVQVESCMDLTDGNIGGCLVLDGAYLSNFGGCSAIQAARLRVAKAALIRDAEILTNGSEASVYFRSASVEGGLRHPEVVLR